MFRLTGDKRGNDEWQNHEFEKPHEKFSRVTDVVDGMVVQVVSPEQDPDEDAEADPREGYDQEHVLAQPGLEALISELSHTLLHLETSGL